MTITTSHPSPAGSITDVAGIEVGHCTVTIAREGAVAGVDMPLLAGNTTTIGVVATDALLTKAQAHRLAQVAHDSLARPAAP